MKLISKRIVQCVNESKTTAVTATYDWQPSMIAKPLFAFLAFLFLAFTACRKHGKPPTIPTLTTTSATNITANSAMAGGSIISDGGSPIIYSGVCFSKTSNMPSVSDDTTITSVTAGTFSCVITNIEPGATYYVRAFATNDVGTGYGEVISFNTGNAAPVAKNVTISGTPKVGEELTGSYSYEDAEGDDQETSTFKWYRANDGSGEGEAAIEGATNLKYIIQDEDAGKYIRFGVTPKAATGTPTGNEVKSNFTTGVGEETEVTFTYNGAQVTYGIIVSSVTGRKWLDRNLGAASAPSAFDDWANFGDLFQWGRAADGHQLVTRTGLADDNATGSQVFGTAEEPALSESDDPGHAFFILNNNHSIATYDWRNPPNDSLWQGVNGINNPCPTGWRLPTKDEWQSEKLDDHMEAYSQLKLTLTGARAQWSGSFTGTPTNGIYWSLSNALIPTTSIKGSVRLYIDLFSGVSMEPYLRAEGLAVRCIKD